MRHALCILLLVAGPACAVDKTVEQVAESAKKSVVVVTFTGRDGQREGLGTGFVVSADGLIATNLHVLGEGRPIAVETADGKRYDVTTVHAFDRTLDLALIRIDAKELTPLPLGDSDKLKQGQSIVVMGNPHGLRHSVVAGVVSGTPEIEGRKMIQVAIPIEQGNSGGPLLDMQGRVHGIVTMKSLVTSNLGFAMPVNRLKTLIDKPNPVPMARWLTIGVLDPADWQTLLGARWRQRAGRIMVEGMGTGFGGRSLCLSQRPVPEVPFEIAVTVKLDDEAGAAGLVFHADGGNVHYGFYPTGAQFRLTRFDGPDVFSWKILVEERSIHYHLGDWNRLKVRVEKDKILCYVNDQLVIESADKELTSGKVGLAKFRDTKAEFKSFVVARQVPSTSISPEVMARVKKAVSELPAQEVPKPNLVEKLVTEGPAGVNALRERAKLLEQQAAQLRQLAQAVHQQRIRSELRKALAGEEGRIDLLHATLLLARLDNDELDIDAYRQEFSRLARDLANSLPKKADEPAKLAALNKFFFSDKGFHGSRADYYNRTNSYVNEVLDDREGLPITLSVIYMELARSIGLNIVGVGLPGHFVVRHVPAKGEPQIIDVYEGGQTLSRPEAEKRVPAMTGRPFREEYLAAVSKRAIVVRMLQNLSAVARQEGDAEGLLAYLDTIIDLTPDASDARWTRAQLRAQTGRRDGAIADIDWFLEHRPEGFDVERLLKFRQQLNRPEK